MLHVTFCSVERISGFVLEDAVPISGCSCERTQVCGCGFTREVFDPGPAEEYMGQMSVGGALCHGFIGITSLEDDKKGSERQ